IEDDPAIVTSLQEILTADGYAVSLAKRGDEGLAIAQSGDFHVVVTDLKLPGLSGLELIRQLHTTKPRLPLILMTAHGTTERASFLGMNGELSPERRRGGSDVLSRPIEEPFSWMRLAT